MEDLNMCFACGKSNPIGLKLNFNQVDDKKVMTTFVPEDVHQGYPGIMHGGLVTTLMDEAMAKVMNLRGIVAVTATLEVKFRQRVTIGEKLNIWGELLEEKNKRCRIKSWITDQTGLVLAEAQSVFIKI